MKIVHFLITGALNFTRKSFIMSLNSFNSHSTIIFDSITDHKCGMQVSLNMVNFVVIAKSATVSFKKCMAINLIVCYFQFKSTRVPRKSSVII